MADAVCDLCPLQTVYAGSGVVKLELPASTPGGVGPTYWRLGQGRSENGLGASPPPASSVYFDGSDYQRGLLSINSDALPVGSMPVVAIMSGSGGGYISLDFELRVLQKNSTSRPPPQITGRAWQTLSAGADSGGGRAGEGEKGGATFGLIEAYAGFEAIVDLTATPRASLVPGGNVSVGANITNLRTYVMPVGAELTPPRSSNASLPPPAGAGPNVTSVGVIVLSRELRWTPGLGQVGGLVPVCFEAVDSAGLSSGQQCLSVKVLGNPGPPLFTSHPGGGNVTVSMRMMSAARISMQAVSLNPFVRLSIFVDPSTPLEGGQYLSVPVQTEGRKMATENATRAAVSAVFAWTPGVSYGGYRRRLCFVAAAADGAPGGSSSRVCFDISVERCRYRVKAGDTFQSIARTFGVDWLTLWGLNVNSKSVVPTVGEDISVGRAYDVAHGDTLLSISKVG